MPFSAAKVRDLKTRPGEKQTGSNSGKVTLTQGHTKTS